MRLLTSLLWATVFVVLLLFAIKNAEPVTLQFYFDRAWQAPLVFVVLASFAAGAVFGVVACVPSLVRQRLQIAGVRKELSLRATAAPEPRALAPADVPSVP